MRLVDFRILSNVQVLSESKNSGTMKIRGLFQRADEVNQNQRRYPKKVLAEAVNSLQSAIEGKRLYGELDHPPSEVVKLSNASHLITKLEMKGNDVVGEATLLGTPAGPIKKDRCTENTYKLERVTMTKHTKKVVKSGVPTQLDVR